MDDNLQISLPHKCGYINHNTHQGILTVMVYDTRKNPVTGLGAENFHICFQAKFVSELIVQEKADGVYMLQFSFDKQHVAEDKWEGMIMVKRHEHYSSTLLVPFHH